MRKILVALAAGLFVFTLTACGGSSNKAKTASSDSDSSDSNTDSSDSDTRSSKSSSSNGGSADAYCAQIQGIASVFSDLDSGGVPTDTEIDALVGALKDLQDAAPSEIQAEMKTFIDVEVAAASAAKAAANNSDAQSSAADKVISQASDEFIAAVTKVDQFTTETCGFDISGQPVDSSSS